MGLLLLNQNLLFLQGTLLNLLLLLQAAPVKAHAQHFLGFINTISQGALSLRPTVAAPKLYVKETV